LKKKTISDNLNVMILFFLTLIPLILIGLVLAHTSKSFGVKTFLENVFWGLKLFFPALLLYLIITLFFHLNHTPRGIFFFRLIRDYLVWSVLWLTGYGLIYRWMENSLEAAVRELIGYGLGFFLLTAVVDCIANFGSYDIYNLFLLPLLRVGLLFGAAFLVAWGRTRDRRIMGVTFGLAIPLSCLGALPALLFYLGRPGWAVFLTLIIVIAGLTPLVLSRLKGVVTLV
jgi:hypothetical protein